MSAGVRNVSVSSFEQSDTDAEFLATAERHGFLVYNDSAVDLYLRFGTAAASASDFTVKLVAGAYFEAPASYDGPVHGVFASAGAGFAYVTEIGA